MVRISETLGVLLLLYISRLVKQYFFYANTAAADAWPVAGGEQSCAPAWGRESLPPPFVLRFSTQSLKGAKGQLLETSRTVRTRHQENFIFILQFATACCVF